MNWAGYEDEIYEYFKITYPESNIIYNKSLIGLYSKTSRQIDILIEHYVAGKKVRIIVDGKYYNKKIDVKDVESFISMVEDLQAASGILITNKGYSKAAMNRAYFGPSQIELDILNFDELKESQGYIAIPFAGQYGVVMPAPFGWIIDASKREHAIANLYQRGISFEQAFENKELIYVNTFQFDKQISNLDALIEHQARNTKANSPNAIFKYEDSIKRADGARTLIRRIDDDHNYDFIEYTGFVQFEEFCLVCVLFTPETLSIKNIRKLEYIMERVVPIGVDTESILKGRLRDAEEMLKGELSDVEISDIYIYQGDQLKAYNHYEEADAMYDKALAICPRNYGATKGKIILCFLLNKERELLDKYVDAFLDLDPSNIILGRDISNMYHDYGPFEDFQSLLESLINLYKRKTLEYIDGRPHATFLTHLGLQYINAGKKSLAKKELLKAKKILGKKTKENSSAINLIGTLLNMC